MRTRTFEEIKDEVFGKVGSAERDKLERELRSFRIGLKIREARKQLNMTQEELAARINKKRSFISKVENDGSNITLTTLYDIVEKGLGGRVNIEVLVENPTLEFDPEFAGGTLLDLNIYNLNFVVSLWGKPDKVFYFPVSGYNGIDTSGVAILSYPTFVAECVAAKDSDSPGFMQVQGEEGWIKIEGAPDDFKALHICVGNEIRTISLKTLNLKLRTK